MKHIHNIGHRKQKTYLILPFTILFLLLIGIMVSLVQLRQQQQLNTRAASPTGPLDCTVAEAQLATSSAEQDMFEQINDYRQQQGVSPLSWSPVLKKAATWMSNDMLTHAKLSHIDSLGRNIEPRISDCGYILPASLGENIDSGSASPSSVLATWKHAPPHNAALLSNNFTEVGVSLATGSASQAYWTLNLAGPAVSPSATITLSTTPVASTSPSISPSTTATPSGSVTPNLSPTKKLTPTPTLIAIPTNMLTPTKVPTAQPTQQVPTPTTYPGFVRNPLDTQLLVSLKIPSIGAGGNKSPKNVTRPVDVTLYDTQNKQVAKVTGQVKYDGDLFNGLIHLGTVPNGTYYIKIASPFTLQKFAKPEFQTLKNDKLNVLPRLTVIQGDLNKDNVLTLVDYNLALSCFQAKACATKNAIDLNDDGVVNVADYNLLLQNFWEYRGD